ncbi:MAG TPA: hypothetical protein VF941_13605 [Clostridia bacterium]
MNNQLLMWSLFILPWLTLFFINRKDLKRFMPATLFTALTSGIILQVGYSTNLWYFREASFPLIMYGLLPIASLWVIRFTYSSFRIYMVTNAILDLVFAFVIIPCFGRVGVFGVWNWTSVSVYIINLIHSFLIYVYQKWQEGHT